jgi:hypothetical protein
MISRPHLAQYHHIRQGILTLMLHMTAYAIGATDNLRPDLAFAKPFLRTDKEIRALICCQVLQTLLKRLAGLQSTYFLRDEILEKVLNTFAQLRETYFAQGMDSVGEYQMFNPFPTQEQVNQSIIKVVKWASSCGDDENGCRLIEASFSKKGGGLNRGYDNIIAIPAITPGKHPTLGQGGWNSFTWAIEENAKKASPTTFLGSRAI